MEKYLIYGTGKSGVCAGKLLINHNNEVVFFDENRGLDTFGFKEKNPEFKNCEIILGDLFPEDLVNLSGAVVSPGVPLNHEGVKTLKDNNIEIIGELELGYKYEKGQVIAITGTNGKTTTTSLVGHILTEAKIKTFVAGNIGDPYTACCDKTSEDSVTVLEVSSFQLETVKSFSPKIAAVLNITPDHLDRHGSFDNYAAVKMSIGDNLKDDGVFVLNKDDETISLLGKAYNKSIAHFSSETELSRGLFLRDGNIIYKDENGEQRIIAVNELNILGKHNYENAMAACAICINMGIPMDVIRDALRSFEAVEHRIEFVLEKNGVRFYNDSKGTNPDAAIKAVYAMDRPIVLIGGGYDKRADYTEWVRTFDGRVKHIVLIGDSARDIASCCDKNGFSNYSFEDTFDSAVISAVGIADKGDCVLLSPACASWGMFNNFEERGRLFKELVRG